MYSSDIEADSRRPRLPGGLVKVFWRFRAAAMADASNGSIRETRASRGVETNERVTFVSSEMERLLQQWHLT